MGLGVIVAGLQQSVVDGLPGIFAKWEGPRLPFMYTDVKGIVTCATGNALFSAADADALSWYHPSDGTPCTKAEVDAAYAVVKAAWPAVQSTACAKLTTIRLTAAAITGLIDRTIAQDWGYLLAQYPGCDAFPADAQLMLLSSSWAWGSYFANVWDKIGKLPSGVGYGTAFKTLMAQAAFIEASGIVREASAHEEKINPGIVPRDLAEVLMLQNANAVAIAKDDVTKLWYPATYAGAAVS
jgi:hypothetical protein